jgi:hypothetical protein
MKALGLGIGSAGRGRGGRRGHVATGIRRIVGIRRIGGMRLNRCRRQRSRYALSAGKETPGRRSLTHQQLDDNLLSVNHASTTA